MSLYKEELHLVLSWLFISTPNREFIPFPPHISSLEGNEKAGADFKKGDLGGGRRQGQDKGWLMARWLDRAMGDGAEHKWGMEWIQ